MHNKQKNFRLVFKMLHLKYLTILIQKKSLFKYNKKLWSIMMNKNLTNKNNQMQMFNDAVFEFNGNPLLLFIFFFHDYLTIFFSLCIFAFRIHTYTSHFYTSFRYIYFFLYSIYSTRKIIIWLKIPVAFILVT